MRTQPWRDPLRRPSGSSVASGTCNYDSGNALSPEDAVIWSSDGKIHRVESLLTAAGLNLGGARLWTAKVHRDGRLLWGGAQLPNGDLMSYIARLP